MLKSNSLCNIFSILYGTQNTMHCTYCKYHLFLFQVRAELKKRWQEFTCGQRLDIRNCVRGMHPKYLWKCSQRTAAAQSAVNHSETYQEAGGGSGDQMHTTHLLQVPAQAGKNPQWVGRVTALEFYPRKSLSSSDGEMTLGETMEEILEESEF